MKPAFLLTLLLTCFLASAQYYYKDIIGTKETTDLIKNYRNNKVSRVVLNSYDADDTKSEDFFVEQIFSPSEQTLKTITRSGVTGESVLIAFADANGNIIKTVDSSDTSTSVRIVTPSCTGRRTSADRPSRTPYTRFRARPNAPT